ncbi:MAG: PAS domain S-box protein [Desulfobacteraceae bacterium]|nr:MAG: PAS domain S-box protein [Desulfobacteraceae bacterium]
MAEEDSKIKLLLVDDEEPNFFPFRDFRAEYEILTATSAGEAHATFLREGDIAIVVADHRMPGQSGIELFEELIAIDPDAVRILITGFSDVETAVAAINRGQVHTYLTKPWKKQEMELALRRARESYLLAAHNRALLKELAAKNKALEAANVKLEKDIRKRLAVETALRESEEKFRQMAESIQDLFWIRDITGEKMHYISPAYERIWGRGCAEMYADPWSWVESIHPDDRDYVAKLHMQEPNPSLVAEYRVIHPDGTVRWVRSRSFPVRDPEGRTYRVTGLVEDITEVRTVEMKLEQSELRCRAIFDTSIDGICTLEMGPDPIGPAVRMLECNDSCARMAGRSRRELLSCRNIRMLQENETGCRGLIERENDFSACAGSFSWIRPDGQENYIDCRGAPFAAGDSTIMHCVLRDVTSRRKAEKEICDLSRRVMKVAEEERRRIAQDFHDEFGQSFLALRSTIEGVRDSLPDSLAANKTAFGELLGLIERLGDSVRNVSAQLRPEILDRLGLMTALESCLDDFRRQHPHMTVEFQKFGAHKRISPEIEIILYRIFQEGLTNIAKHARASSVTTVLTFSFPGVILLLKDDGAGFSPDAAKANQGIGLTGMRERVASVGGELVIRSQAGIGTTIRAKLPLS